MKCMIRGVEPMKKIIGIMASIVLMASFAHATYIGGGQGNDKEKWVMNNITFADGVWADTDFYFDYVNKFDEKGKWDSSSWTEWTVDGITIKPETYNEKGEIIGVSFTIDPDKIKPGLEFVSLKAGSGRKDKEGGFTFYSIDLTDGNTFSLSTKDGLGGKAISHISLWKGSPKGNITYPGSGGDAGAQVPEPATIFLLGSGLLGLFGYRKKFWKSKPSDKE